MQGSKNSSVGQDDQITNGTKRSASQILPGIGETLPQALCGLPVRKLLILIKRFASRRKLRLVTVKAIASEISCENKDHW